MQFGIRKDKSMSSNKIVERWAEGPVKMQSVWFFLDFQIEKTWSEVTSKVTALTQTWSGRALSLRYHRKVGVIQILIALPGWGAGIVTTCEVFISPS